MSVATKLQTSVKPVRELRRILGPTGNMVRVLEEPKRKPEAPKKVQRTKLPVPELPPSVVENNVSVNRSCSSGSSSSASPVKAVGSSRRKTRDTKANIFRPVKSKIVPESEVSDAEIIGPSKRCDWITPNSDPLYTSFHDEEWGVPVHDDRKLLELLVFSQALAELSWPAILSKREVFRQNKAEKSSVRVKDEMAGEQTISSLMSSFCRKLLEDFDPSSIELLTEKKLQSLKVNGKLLLSEQKLRAVVQNAKQILKVQQEFGSFSHYCWSFVNDKPVRNRFRCTRQVPVRTPKAELMSKDMMQRGFRCVGPTIIYSFMQVAGIVNDHLVTCFRYNECSSRGKEGFDNDQKGH